MTQAVGIASMLVVVRIGLGIDALASKPPSSIQDLESQDLLTQTIEDHTDIPSNESRQTIQPFLLKYHQSHQSSQLGGNDVFTSQSVGSGLLVGQHKHSPIQPLDRVVHAKRVGVGS
ncbi:hypothetical protein BT96DRAFT_443487 [Gymnopus androsaceus JB14]|uniref:Uncharacterized protein n=1 Tax=Gymnopus androsaceus JB14 TaxID=1447944 RepID=A0A6A4GSI3_9AGAR|nr:hypothetical protein BT96DRAFT_443487 [Gymnopus androsaceus JB14]